MGFVAAAEVVPMVLAAVPSGAIMIRLGPLRTLIACDAARALLTVAIPVLYGLDALPFPVVLGLAMAIGAFFPAHGTSQLTMLAQLAGNEGAAALTRANALLHLANRLPLTVGPALAGLFIGIAGAPAVLVIDAASYLASLMVLLVLAARTTPVMAPVASDTRGAWVGARHLAYDPVLRPLTTSSAGIEMAMQMVFISLPILAYTMYDARVSISSAWFSAWVAGTVLGTPIAVRLAHRRPAVVLRMGLIGQAAPLWILAFQFPPWLLATALFLSGLANPVARAPSNALLALRSTEELRSKVILAYFTALLGASGAALLLSGPLAEEIGGRSVLLCAAMVATACATVFAMASTKTPLDEHRSRAGQHDPAGDHIAGSTDREPSALRVLHKPSPGEFSANRRA